MGEAPQVFISYSHDSAGHRLRVLELANRLRREGIDARLDRYVAFPAEGWPRWMRSQIEEADLVLVICTETYRARFDGTDSSERGLGVRWEGLILTQALYEDLSRDAARFIPVLFDDTPSDAVPISLRPFSRFRLPDQYDALYRLLTDQPEVEVPDVGMVRSLAPKHRATAGSALPVVSRGADEDIQTGTQGGPVGVAKVPGSDAAPWIEANDAALEVLRERWHARRLTLVIGAGVSVAFGLPTWQELLSNLLASYVKRTYSETLSADAINEIQHTLKNEFQGVSPIQTAEFIQSVVPGDEFSDILKSSLYQRMNFRCTENPILDALVSLYAGLHGIVSFNFDDILEQALEERGLDFTSVIDGRDLGRIRGLPVYHPHGFLPRSGTGSSTVVFAESQYHTQYSENYSWTNIVVQRLLLESTCLFVGTSLSDPNLRRMIDLAHRQNPLQHHYFLTVGSRQSKEHLREAVDEILQASYEAIGVNPVWLDAYDEMPPLLNSIRDA